MYIYGTFRKLQESRERKQSVNKRMFRKKRKYSVSARGKRSVNIRNCMQRFRQKRCRNRFARFRLWTDTHVTVPSAFFLEPCCTFPILNAHYSSRFHVNDYLWEPRNKTDDQSGQTKLSSFYSHYYMRSPDSSAEFFTCKFRPIENAS